MVIVVPLRLFFLLIILAIDLSGQVVPLNVDVLDHNNGLSGGAHFVYHDSRGFIWILDYDGLSRFDGAHTINYESGNDSTQYQGKRIISNAVEDESGNLWFTTTDAVNCYDRLSGLFRKFYYNDVEISKFDVSLKILNDRELLLICNTCNRFLKLDFSNGTWQRLYRIEYEEALLQSAIGSDVLLVADGRSVLRISKGSNGKLKRETVLESVENAMLYSFITTKENVAWLSNETELIRYELSDNEMKRFALPDQVRLTHSQSLPEWNRKIYLHTTDSKILLFDLELEQFEQNETLLVETGSGRSLGDFVVSYISPEGLLLANSNLQGVAYTFLPKQKFKTVESILEFVEPDEDAFVRGMAEDHAGYVWCAIAGGTVLKLDRNQQVVDHFKFSELCPGYEAGGFEHIRFDESGRGWFSNFLGISVLNPDTRKVIVLRSPAFEANPNSNWWTRTLQLQDARILAQRNQGNPCFIIETATGFEMEEIMVNDMPKNFNLHTMHQDSRGNIWVSSETHLSVLREVSATEFTVERSFVLNAPVKGYYDDGDSVLWCAGGAGLLRINLNDYSTTVFKKSDGLPDDFVYNIVPDHSGNFWLSTNKGICRVNFKMLLDSSLAFEKGQVQSPLSGWRGAGGEACRNYSLADGLQGWEFNSNAYCVTSWGEVWMGGMNGINTFYPDEVKDINSPSSVQITELLVNDKPTLNYGNPGEITELKLPFELNTLQFNTTAIDFSDVAACKVLCKLEGVDNDWVTISNPGFIRYPNIPHGHYTFIIRATNSDGVWNKEEKRIAITILPPWYRTNAFYAVCAFFVLGTLYLIQRNRIQRIRKEEKLKLQVMVTTQEEERRRLARNLHDDVGAQLSAVKLFISAMDKNKETDVATKEKSIEILNSSIEDIRNILINLSPKSLDEHGYVIAVEELVNKINRSNTVRFALTLHGLNERLPKEIETNLFRITQELINNTLKHSGATEIVLDISKTENKLLLNYEDNGRGFHYTGDGTGYGLQNIRSRVEMMRGRLNVDTAPGKGLRVQVEIVMGD